MSSQKNKAIVEPTSTAQAKATWDLKTTELFIRACVDQVLKGERNGTTLTKNGWRAVITQFNNVSGKNYDKSQLKNKWDSLKKEWQAWHKLFGKETGLGWDSVKNTVDAPDEWWEKKQAENPQYAKFRNKGLPFANELTILFKDVVATGQYAWAPTSGILPTDSNNDDVYRPTLDNIDIDTEEGTGDSEEDINAVATHEMGNINLIPSQGVSSQRSGEKRKRAGDRKGKAKKPVSVRIADAVSIMAETCRSRSESVKELVATIPGSSIGEVVGELLKIEAVRADMDFYGRCCSLMLQKPAREMFVAMRAEEDMLVAWLRFAAYNSQDTPKE